MIIGATATVVIKTGRMDKLGSEGWQYWAKVVSVTSEAASIASAPQSPISEFYGHTHAEAESKAYAAVVRALTPN